MVSAITIQFAFIFEPAESGIMERKPRKTGGSLLNWHDIFQMAYVSICIAIISLLSYEWLISEGANQATASTMMVNIIVLCKIFYLFNIRTAKPTFSKEFFTNPMAFKIIGVMLLLQVILTYVPFMQGAFHTEELTMLEWGITVLAGISVLLIAEVDKMILIHKKKR